MIKYFYIIIICLLLFLFIGYKFISIDKYVNNLEYVNITSITIQKEKNGYRFFPNITYLTGKIDGKERKFKYYFYPFKSHYPTTIGNNLDLYVNKDDIDNSSEEDIILLPIRNKENLSWQEKESLRKYLLLDKKKFEIITLRQISVIILLLFIMYLIYKLKSKH